VTPVETQAFFFVWAVAEPPLLWAASQASGMWPTQSARERAALWQVSVHPYRGIHLWRKNNKDGLDKKRLPYIV